MGSRAVTLRSVKPQQQAFAVGVADILCPYCGYYAPAEGPVIGKYVLVGCYRCKEAVMLLIDRDLAPGAVGVFGVTDYHPKKTPSTDPYVPKDIAEDYLEAQPCFNVGAWHGCAVMARRCMHSVTAHFSASGRDLYEQIEDLKTKQIITPV